MSRTLLILFILINSGHLLNAQQIHGIITDSSTHQPLSFVSIGVASLKQGTISNEQGRFVFNIKENKPIILGFSLMGYKVKTVLIHTIHDTFIQVQLTQNVFKLKDVVVSVTSADSIVDKFVSRYLNDPSNKKSNFHSYFRLFTIAKGVTYENLEAIYSTSANFRKVLSLQIENGKYGLIDSFEHKKLLTSIDFSKLISHLNLFNSETYQVVSYPTFPLFINKRKKFVKSVIEKRENLNDEEVIQISLTPKKFYDDRFFNTRIWINAKTLNLEKLTADIYSPVESPIHLTDKSPIIMEQIHIMILFDSFGDSNYTFPKYYSLKFNSVIPKKDSVKVESNLQFINYEKDYEGKYKSNIEYESDFELIQNNLYMKDWWGKNAMLEKSKSEYELNEKFNRMNYYNNCFDTKKDTLSFLNNGFTICGYGKNTNINPSKLNDSAIYFRPDSFVFIQSIDEVPIKVAGLYFDVMIFHACYDGSFRYVCLPVFDNKYSWVVPDYKLSLEMETIMKLLARLTFIYSKKLEQELNQMDDPCLNRMEIELIKAKNYKSFLADKNKIAREIWSKGKFLKWEEKLKQELQNMGYE